MTFAVVMFFVWSSTLSLTPNDLKVAKEQNLSILSYLANELNSPVITIAALSLLLWLLQSLSLVII